jgi:hypothetical protein
MAGGSVLRGRPFRSHQPDTAQPIVGFLPSLGQARRRLGFQQGLRGADVTGSGQREDRPRPDPALGFHAERLPESGVTPDRIK